jgi:hypothetical protein
MFVSRSRSGEQPCSEALTALLTCHGFAHKSNCIQILSDGAHLPRYEKRAAIDKQTFKRISDQAYVAMLFTVPAFDITVHGSRAPA